MHALTLNKVIDKFLLMHENNVRALGIHFQFRKGYNSNFVIQMIQDFVPKKCVDSWKFILVLYCKVSSVT